MRIWSILLVSGLVACTSGTPGDTSEPDDTGENPDTGEEGDLSARLEGTVRGPDGNLLPGADIRFCRGLECRYGTTDAQGAFAFDKALVAWHSLEIVPPADSGLATWFAPIELKTDQHRDLDLTIPALDAAHALSASPTELELGSGLLVTVGESDLEPPLFVPRATHAAGVQVDPAHWPPVDREASEIVAVWFTVPFDHQAASGLPVRIENQWELEEGTSLEVWVGSYGESVWLDAGTLQVGDDGYLTGEAALPLLSTVVLVAP